MTRGRFDDYREILGSDFVRRQVRNSVIVAAITAGVVVPCAPPAAFALDRVSFAGSEVVYTLFTLGLLFPLTVAILPLCTLLRSVDLLNTRLGAALPQAAFAEPRWGSEGARVRWSFSGVVSRAGGARS